MATSAQVAPVRNIALLKEFLDANGFQLLQSQPYSKVNDNLHKKDSFHKDEEKYAGQMQTLAVDVNWANKSQERKKLIWAVPYIQAFGCALIYARDGKYDAAALHTDHIHVDCGKYTNLGLRWVTVTKKNLVVYDTQTILHTPIRTRDNLDGPDTTKRLSAVQAASKAHGTKFPHGIKYTQAVIGAELTGKWDTQSKEAHDATVKKLETLWKKDKLFVGTPDTTWSSATDTALKKFHAKY